MAKIFVEVTARHDTLGNAKPLSIKWEDGRVFEIDRVLDVRQSPSLRRGRLRHPVHLPNSEQAVLFV